MLAYLKATASSAERMLHTEGEYPSQLFNHIATITTSLLKGSKDIIRDIIPTHDEELNKDF